MDPAKTEGTVPQSPQFTWVAAPEPFRRMLETLMPASRVAIDIEADSLYHYFEKVCLVQISTDEETYIVDPLVVRDLSALGPIMADPAVEKVFHAATYDLYCLRRDYGFSFANIFDTHIAAQLLGCNLLGLDALLESFLGITHSKRRQRDDWSHRPLAREQLEYAAMDTRHLLQLRDLLDRHLRDQGTHLLGARGIQIHGGAGVRGEGFRSGGFSPHQGEPGHPVAAAGCSARPLSAARPLCP